LHLIYNLIVFVFGLAASAFGDEELRRLNEVGLAPEMRPARE
jgi:hypothetical protein